MTAKSARRIPPTPNAQRNVAESTLPGLIENAFDFLEGALASFETDPKRSVIDFHTAVELFLKVPLLNEHWTLVVDKSPSLTKFRTGDFVSVTFDEAIKRLADTIASPLSKECIETFNKVRKHRNRYVHFSIENSETVTQSIAVEQLQAWAALHRLLTHEWAGIFASYRTRSSNIEKILRRHREFATAFGKSRLPDVQPELDAAKEAGYTIAHCSGCQVPSMKGTNVVGNYYAFSCLICRANHAEVLVKCQECGEDLSFTGGDGSLSCECGEIISFDAIAEQLDTSPPITKHNYFEQAGPANCGYCGGFETVCEYHDQHLCLECLELTSEVMACEWCSKPTNVALEDSYWAGCEDCEGASGHHRD